jgi:Domain of unknown function (DUF6438)
VNPGAAFSLTILLWALAVGSATGQAAPAPVDYREADSIALERGPCFGTCSMYRVSLAHNGDVHFISLNHGADSGRTASGHARESAFRSLMGVATFGHFYQLPDTIAGVYCQVMVTDMPTAIVTIYYHGRVKPVVDYQGCLWAPVILRNLESAIDEETRSRRWTRPNRF